MLSQAFEDSGGFEIDCVGWEWIRPRMAVSHSNYIRLFLAKIGLRKFDLNSHLDHRRLISRQQSVTPPGPACSFKRRNNHTGHDVVLSTIVSKCQDFMKSHQN